MPIVPKDSDEVIAMAGQYPARYVPSAEALLATMSEAVYVVDRQRRVTYWNPAAEQLTGYQADQVVGRRCRDGILNHVDDKGMSLCKSLCPLLATIGDGKPHDMLAFLHHHDGHRVPVAARAAALLDPDGNITGAVEVFHDDTRNKMLTDRLNDAQRQALTDALTGIANRRMLTQVLRQRRDDQLRYDYPYAVLFADIDHFKRVNDTYNHDVGDRVLQLVSATLRDCTRSGDAVGRWGGEEFLVVATADEADYALNLAERARHLVASTWAQNGADRVGVTLSIGVALAGPGEATDDLVRRADMAMLAAKTNGRNRTVLA
jgi:diguanylate cyclase (GGDEF)-like protein/PAS domain S-box-containing protein